MKKITRVFVVTTLLLCVSLVAAQTAEERQKIVSTYDLKKLNQLQSDLEKDYLTKKAVAEKFAKENNLPLTVRDADGSIKELHYIDTFGNPVYIGTTNVGASQTIRANVVNTGGSLGLNLNGQNMIAGMWEVGGISRITHETFQNRVIIKDNSTETSAHATHVMGTMVGSGAFSANAQGMSYQAAGWANDTANSSAEMAAQAAQGLLVSNHSYGMVVLNDSGNLSVPLYYFGAYLSGSAEIDNIMYNAPYYQAVWAAGNDRDSYQALNPTKNGFDLLTNTSTSKNAIVVGAVFEVPTYTGTSSVLMSSFSNWGPTDDKRIKPDIVSKGVNVYSATDEADNSYSSFQGTSMAAPGVAGALLLLQQHYNNTKGVFMRASTLRGLMIHTADEAGSAAGPDPKFGWGLMNTSRAVQTITKSASTNTSGGAYIKEYTLSQGGTITENLISDGVNPLIVSICWTDPAGPTSNTTVDATTARLVNDLDVVVKKAAVNYYPWSLFGQANTVLNLVPNNVDNVEKVEINSATGTYQMVITHKNTLSSGSQVVSVIVSGIDNTALSVDTNELNNPAKLTIYPNPSNDIFNIKMLNYSDDSVVKVFDVNGRLIKSLKIDSDLVKLDMSQVVDGIYYVNYTDSTNSETQKIVVKK